MKMTLIPQASAAILLLVLTLCLQCAGVAALMEWLRRVTAKDAQGFAPVRSAVLVVQSTIAIILLHGLVILLWASFYRLQCFPSWELAFYFSSSSYATVGYGDVTLPSSWRLLGPIESMAGVLMCGVSVCLLFATITRLIDRDPRHSRKLRYANDPGAPKGNRYASEQNYA
jgi:voltage-gated potassium channel